VTDVTRAVRSTTLLADPTRQAAAAGVAGALCITFSAILVKLADVSPSAAAVYRCAYALPWLIVLGVWEHRRFGPREAGERRFAVLAGVLLAVDLICWHQAIRDVGAGLGTVLGNLQVVIIPFVAWAVLSERPSSRILVVLPVVFVGIVLISGVLEHGAYGENPPRGILFGAATGICYSGFILLLRRGNADIRRPAGPLLDATITATLSALLIALVIGQTDLEPSWPAHGWLATLALTSQVIGWMLISVSLPRLPAALTSMILTVQPVGSVVFGVILLGEEPTILQVAGVAAIVAGLVAIARRRPQEGEQG
jgi:drug/metabolite transporter (DMT)-like permease